MRRSSLRSARSPAVSGREPGRRAEARVAHRERDVHLRLVDPQGLAAERRRAVHEEQRVALAAGGAEAVERLRHPGGALAVHDGERAAVVVHRRDEPLRLQRPAELALDADHLGPGAGQRAREPLAEQPRDAADHAVARGRRSSRSPPPSPAPLEPVSGSVARPRVENASRRRTCVSSMTAVNAGSMGPGGGSHRRRGRSPAGGWDRRRAAAARSGRESSRDGSDEIASTSGKCSVRWERSASRTKRRSSWEATR